MSEIDLVCAKPPGVSVSATVIDALADPLFLTDTLTVAVVPWVTLAGMLTESASASTVEGGGVGVGVGVGGGVPPPRLAALIIGSLELSLSPDHTEALPLAINAERTADGVADGLTAL